jgi:hypothetical protein
MDWQLTVIADDGKTVLFTGSSRDRAEIERVAAEAHRRRPGSRVMIRSPFGGAVTDWVGAGS